MGLAQASMAVPRQGWGDVGSSSGPANLPAAGWSHDAQQLEAVSSREQ